LVNVTKTWNTHAREFHALKSIHFELKKGEMIAITGASGSGKSTLMNILGFLDRCTTGQYFFSDVDVSSLSHDELSHIRNQKTGFIFQSFFLLSRMTVLQNVMLPLFYRNVDKSESHEKALNLLSKVGMETFSNHKPHQLSGGQQQRVAIARALVGNPDIILADEPTGSLDSRTGNEVMQLLLELNQKENRTIVIVTHDEKISRLCQRVVRIQDGTIL
jgi:putative ABC transport system ATP-binding protein